MGSKDERNYESSAQVRCEVCGIIFATEQEREQHKKLEHKEHQRPTGVC
ncbi:MAG TPA: hypothetical protein VJ729_10160 [Nitrososphaeraceae archaeon]|nr:hypothetical protein [Nitrososphaeraceae archaeon]